MKICVLGASPDTGNLGVSALMTSIVRGVHDRCADAQVTVFDNGLGQRHGTLRTTSGEITYQRLGIRLSRRVHLRESLANMQVSQRLGGMGNPGVAAIADADAVWDVSGGDSFTDLYGDRRFRQVVDPKDLVLRIGTPLVLLPQTYGPFTDPARRRRARRIVGKALQAWARDIDSFERLDELLVNVDPERHRCGVDLSFGMEPLEPTGRLPGRLTQWLDADRSHPVVGLNVSGLLHNQDARSQFSLSIDYRELISRLLRRLLDETDARIVLVPHVRGYSFESDDVAVTDVAAAAPAGSSDRIEVVRDEFDASGMKWLISRLDWFNGTRMHATIAALSTGVPVSAVAYSDKTRGVFESCELADAVIDARAVTTDHALAAIWQSWQDRSAVRTHLAASVPRVRDAAHAQMDQIVDACRPGV